MASKPAELNTQHGLAQKALFNDPEFAKRYRLGEPITGAFGKELLIQLRLQNHETSVKFLDLASGTGVIPKMAIEMLRQARSITAEDQFTCTDLAPMMLDALRSRVGAEAWSIDQKQIEVSVGDMRDTKLPSDTYTHVTCSFGPVMAPHPEKVFQESFRMLKPGGVAGWTGWCSLGWYRDVKRALTDIRNAAIQRCKEGNMDEHEQKLSRLPDLQPVDEIVSRFAGIDIRQLRADGVKEEDLPRWDRADFFRSQVRAAGFSDVEVSQVQKTFHVDFTTSTQMTKPVANILATLWTAEQREQLAGVNLAEKMEEWWVRRFQEDDVENGKIVWGDSEALVVSGRKTL